MNAELPPFKHGEHNSDSASTIDRDITPFMDSIMVPGLCLSLDPCLFLIPARNKGDQPIELPFLWGMRMQAVSLLLTHPSKLPQPPDARCNWV